MNLRIVVEEQVMMKLQDLILHERVPKRYRRLLLSFYQFRVGMQAGTFLKVFYFWPSLALRRSIHFIEVIHKPSMKFEIWGGVVFEGSHVEERMLVTASMYRAVFSSSPDKNLTSQIKPDFMRPSLLCPLK